MCTRVEEVEPVADSVVTRRIAEALRISVGAMRLYACHWRIISIAYSDFLR